jgi:TRAP transporter TAXI family solute receptor
MLESVSNTNIARMRRFSMNRRTFNFFVGFSFILLILLAGSASAQQQMTVATASLGGAFYPVGTGIAEVVSKYVPGIKMTAEVTGGSTENPRLVGTGQSDLGICNANHAYQAHRGEPPFARKFDIAVIGALHGSVLHMVTLEKTGVKTVPDLKGKKIAAGPAGGGSVPMLKAVLSVYSEVKFEDLKPSYISYSDGITALKDGNVQAAMIGAGVPAAAVMELGVGEKIRFVEISEAKMAEISKKYPYYSRAIIPAATYKTDKDVLVMGVRNLLVVGSKMNEKTAYEITKAIYTHLNELATYHASVKDVTLKDAVDVAGVPFHPGALKFFKEKGLIQ